MINDPFSSEVGSVQVHTTSHRGHAPEELAEMALNKIISIGDAAPEPIKAQALAYRENLRIILTFYMRQAMLSARTTITAEVTQQVKDNL